MMDKPSVSGGHPQSSALPIQAISAGKTVPVRRHRHGRGSPHSRRRPDRARRQWPAAAGPEPDNKTEGLPSTV